MNNPEIFRKRRERFLEKLNGRAAIIPAASLVTHHADCEYPFRQNSDFWYLTAFDEPEAIALFLPHRSKGEQYVMFVLPKEESAEVWNGFRWGVDGVVQNFDVEIAHSLEEFETLVGTYLHGANGIAFRIGKYPRIEKIILKVWAKQLDQSPRNGFAPYSMSPPCPILHDLRLRKDAWEISRMKEAAKISAKAHEHAREITSSGKSEKQIQAEIEHVFIQEGARGPAYGSIVAGGDNACVLHYTANNSLLCNGDLLLIDAGCSLIDYYNGDITRTFPINGKFTAEQKAVYEIVLTSQKAAIESVVLGKNAEAVHLKALRILIEGLIEIGLLKGQIDSIIEEGAFSHLYMHKTGHWLGLDVHDVGAYRLGEYAVDLEAGMVLTVEPGIYISDRIPVPSGQPKIDDKWKGLGIRIEDDVLVTDSGPDVLSSDALKSIEDMER